MIPTTAPLQKSVRSVETLKAPKPAKKPAQRVNFIYPSIIGARNKQPVLTFDRQCRFFVLAFLGEPYFPRNYEIPMCRLWDVL
jgi:hypothetical protein